MKTEKIITDQVFAAEDEYLTNSCQKYNNMVHPEYIRKQMVDIHRKNDVRSNITDGEKHSNSASFLVDYVRKKMVFG